jgi:hypothetical protein
MNVILDLDHCLIYSSYSEIEGLDLVDKKGYLFLYHRPGLKEFLNQVIKMKNINLVFYTSAKADYARWVVQSFNLDVNYRLFTRSNTRMKYTDYGQLYYKSIEKIGISKTERNVVLDDRIDLWDSTGVDLIDIDQWHGEPNDKKLEEAFVTIYKLINKDNRRAIFPF